MADYRDLSDTQRFAHLVFWYEHEIQNGGHLQYFENHGTDVGSEAVNALRFLGAHCQADVLERAVAKAFLWTRQKIESVEEYVETALLDEFDSLDQAFHACKTPLTKTLETFLEQNRPEFVVIID